MVGSRHPERDSSLHPAPAREHILDAVVQAVTHVQHRSHVRRRNDDHVRLIAITKNALRIGAEVAAFFPVAVERRLDRACVVLRRKWFWHCETLARERVMLQIKTPPRLRARAAFPYFGTGLYTGSRRSIADTSDSGPSMSTRSTERSREIMSWLSSRCCGSVSEPCLRLPMPTPIPYQCVPP